MKLTENILRQTIKEVIDEILGNDLEEQFADPKTVSHALDPNKPARRKPLPVVKGVPGRKRKGESAQQFKQRVLKKAQNEDLDETWDPVAGSAALDVPAMEEELYEELDELDELDVPDIQPEVPEVKPPPVPPEVERPVSGMTIKEQVSAKHDRIFESLVKKVTKR